MNSPDVSLIKTFSPKYYCFFSLKSPLIGVFWWQTTYYNNVMAFGRCKGGRDFNLSTFTTKYFILIAAISQDLDLTGRCRTKRDEIDRSEKYGNTPGWHEKVWKGVHDYIHMGLEVGSYWFLWIHLQHDLDESHLFLHGHYIQGCDKKMKGYQGCETSHILFSNQTVFSHITLHLSFGMFSFYILPLTSIFGHLFFSVHTQIQRCDFKGEVQ